MTTIENLRNDLADAEQATRAHIINLDLDKARAEQARVDRIKAKIARAEKKAGN